MDTLPKKIGTRLLFKFWERHYTPFGILRCTGRCGSNKFLDFYLKKRMPLVTDEEKAEVKSYLH